MLHLDDVKDAVLSRRAQEEGAARACKPVARRQTGHTRLGATVLVVAALALLSLCGAAAFAQEKEIDTVFVQGSKEPRAHPARTRGCRPFRRRCLQP